MNSFRLKLTWASQNKLFWAHIALALVFITVVWIFPAPNASDFRIRLVGCFYQLIGVVTVWVDIAGAAKMFGKGGMLSRTWTWLKAGFFKKDAVIGVSATASAAATASARLTVRWPINSDAEISARVEILEKNLVKMDEDVQALFSQVAQVDAAAMLKVAEEASARIKMIADMRHDLGEVAAGNFQVLAFGAFWLAVGIIVSTFSPEIAKTVNGDWASVVKAL